MKRIINVFYIDLAFLSKLFYNFLQGNINFLQLPGIKFNVNAKYFKTFTVALSRLGNFDGIF